MIKRRIAGDTAPALNPNRTLDNTKAQSSVAHTMPNIETAASATPAGIICAVRPRSASGARAICATNPARNPAAVMTPSSLSENPNRLLNSANSVNTEP